MDPENTMNYHHPSVDWALIVDKPSSMVQQTTKVRCIDAQNRAIERSGESKSSASRTIGHLRANLAEQLGM